MLEGDAATVGEQTGRLAHPTAKTNGLSTPGWVGIAANAGSGLGAGRRRVEQLVDQLQRHGLQSQVAWSVSARQELVAASAQDSACRCIVAVGGDGTVGGLVNEQPSVPITVLPAGTENLFARHFGLTKHPNRLAAMIADGRIVPIDVGSTGVHRFTLMAGIGFDADVVTRHHAVRVNATGVARPTTRVAYVESVLRSALRYRFPPLTVRVTDPGHEETLVGTSVFLFNLPRYALGLPFAPTAQGDDGYLDLIVFREAGPFRALYYLWLVIRGLHLDRPGVFHRKVRRVEVSAAEYVPIQLDGDPGGDVNPDTCWSAEVIPHAVDVLIPARA